MLGYNTHLFYTDRGLLRRLNKPILEVTTQDLENIIMSVTKQGTKALYRTRIRSVFNSLRDMEIVPMDFQPDARVPKIKKPRTYPRPLTQNEVSLLLSQAAQPMRDMITLSCYAGMRAMEIAQVRGVDLEDRQEGWYIRIPNGKGRTDLSLPAHPLIIEVFERRKTMGNFWNYRANDVSQMCCTEMRRLGVIKKLHSGRHFFATNAYAASNGDLLAVSKLMRHTSVATTQIYAELGSEVARSVINNLTLPRSVDDA
jgi:integrase